MATGLSAGVMLEAIGEGKGVMQFVKQQLPSFVRGVGLVAYLSVAVRTLYIHKPQHITVPVAYSYVPKHCV